MFKAIKQLWGRLFAKKTTRAPNGYVTHAEFNRQRTSPTITPQEFDQRMKALGIDLPEPEAKE